MDSLSPLSNRPLSRVQSANQARGRQLSTIPTSKGFAHDELMCAVIPVLIGRSIAPKNVRVALVCRLRVVVVSRSEEKNGGRRRKGATDSPGPLPIRSLSRGRIDVHACEGQNRQLRATIGISSRGSRAVSSGTGARMLRSRRPGTRVGSDGVGQGWHITFLGHTSQGEG